MALKSRIRIALALSVPCLGLLAAVQHLNAQAPGMSGKLVQAGTMSELTAQAAEFRVQIGRGSPPVDEMQLLPGVSGVSWDEPSRTLLVRYDGRKHASDEVITRVLKLIIERDATIVTVSRGRKLEERVLQLT